MTKSRKRDSTEPIQGMTPAEDEDELGLEDFATPPDNQGLSLEELSQAYAELIGGGEEPYDADEPLVEQIEGEEQGSADSEDEADAGLEAADGCSVTPRSILEAMLFVGHPENAPLEAKHVASLMRGVRPAEIDQLIQELNQLYEQQGAPYYVASVGSGYRLQLREEFHRLRDKFHGRVREARLSAAAVDVLALVAYQQGITRAQIEARRGSPTGALLNQLVRRQLLRVERSETKPQTRRYFTTDRFLRLFGLSDLDELPRSQDSEKAP